MLSGHDAQKSKPGKHHFLRFAAGLFVFLMALSAAAFIVLPLPGAIPVLMYHFVGTPEEAAGQKNYVSRQSFEKQVAFLSRFGYRALTIEEYGDIVTGRRKPRGREILITFDDGSTTFPRAFPALERYRVPVTLFLVSEAVKQDLPSSMPHEEIQKMRSSGLISIGSHSKTHPFLSQMSDAEIQEELAGSKKDLEALFGVPVKSFAYPLGDYDQRVMDAAGKLGYEFAFTTASKKLKGYKPGLFNLTRDKVTATDDYPVVFWFRISGLYQFFKQALHQVRYGTAY